jgi:hypothetical protein
MILEMTDGSEIRLDDTIWTTKTARMLKRIIEREGGAALTTAGNGFPEELAQEMVQLLHEIRDAVKAPRSLVETAAGMLKSIQDEDPRALTVSYLDEPLK